MDLRCFSFTRAAVFTFAILTISLSAGCGGGDASHAIISGSVTINGAPLKEGKIVVRSLDAGAGKGAFAEVVDGQYELTKVPIGSNIFTFSGSTLTGKSIPGPGGQPEPERANVVPRKILQDGIERKIESDGTQDFSLEGPV